HRVRCKRPTPRTPKPTPDGQANLWHGLSQPPHQAHVPATFSLAARHKCVPQPPSAGVAHKPKLCVKTPSPEGYLGLDISKLSQERRLVSFLNSEFLQVLCQAIYFLVCRIYSLLY